MKNNFVCCCFCFVHSKIIKHKNYKVVKQHEEIAKEHFDAGRPRDFSDLVANNIAEKRNEEEEENICMIDENNNLRYIQEVKNDSASSPGENRVVSKMESFLEQFNDPKSSSSSNGNAMQNRIQTSSIESRSGESIKISNTSKENLIFTQKENSRNPYRNALITDPKIIRNPTDIINQVHETKFASNNDGFSHTNRDSEMVDHHNDDSTSNILISKNNARFIRSNASEQTLSCHRDKNIIKNNIGKSTRSRNMHNPIKASLDSTDSQKKLISNKRHDEATVDKTLDLTLQKMQKRKRKSKQQTTNIQDSSYDEQSDFETFRNLNSDMATSFKQNLKIIGKINSQKSEDSGLITERLQPESRTRNQVLNKMGMGKTNESKFSQEISLNPPKIMGFFENSATNDLSRNQSSKNAKTAEMHKSKCPISYFLDKPLDQHSTKVELMQIAEPERQLSLSPRFANEEMTNTLDGSKFVDSQGREIKFSDNNIGRQHNTVGEVDTKYGHSRRTTGKTAKRMQLKENFLNSSRKKYVL